MPDGAYAHKMTQINAKTISDNFFVCIICTLLGTKLIVQWVLVYL